MRPIFATLVVLLALAAATSSPAQAPSVSVSVSASPPTAPSRGREPRGQRTYSVAFRVSVGSDQECENLSVTYSYAARFDGRPSIAGSGTDYYDTNKPASSASFEVRASGDAGDVISFSARGACEEEDGTVLDQSSAVAAKVRVPAHSCERGPLRVLGTKGATRQDLGAPTRRVPVRSGHYLWVGYRVWVAPRGRITYGAAECNRLSTTVRGAAFVPGDYSRGGYGAPTRLGFGGVAVVRGDQHSGGVETDNAIALPRGKRSGPSAVARFEVVSYARKPGRVTCVHVSGGRVYVAGRTGRARYGKPLIARPGQTVFVRCSGRTCSPQAASATTRSAAAVR